MLASLFQFSFLCVIALANLCLGFAIASHLGWGPRLEAVFQLNRVTPAERLNTRDREFSEIAAAEPAAVEGATDVDTSDSVKPLPASDPVTATARAVLQKTG